MPAPITFRVRYTADHCLASAWRYWQRRLGYRYVLEVAIGCGLLVLAGQGPYRWIEVALAIAVGIFAILGAGVFFVHWLRGREAFAALSPPESHWVLQEETIGQRSSLGESAIAWKGLQEVWRFDDVWLLVWGRDLYSTLPTDQLPRDAREYIVERVKDSGGRVR